MPSILAEPNMSSLGRFFPRPPKAYSMTNPQLIHAVTSSNLSNSGCIYLRNTWAFHGALAMLAEGVMERSMLPRVTSTMINSVSDCAGLIGMNEFAWVAERLGDEEYLSKYADLKRFTGFGLLGRTVAVASSLITKKTPESLTLPDGTVIQLYANLVGGAETPHNVNIWLDVGQEHVIKGLMPFPIQYTTMDGPGYGLSEFPGVKDLLSAWPHGAVRFISDSPIYFEEVYVNAYGLMDAMRKFVGHAFVNYAARYMMWELAPEWISYLANVPRVSYAAIEIVAWILGWTTSSAAVIPYTPKIKHIETKRKIVYNITTMGEVEIEEQEINEEDKYLEELKFENTVDSYLDGFWEIPGNPGGSITYSGSANPTEDYIANHLVGDPWTNPEDMIERQMVDMSELEWNVDSMSHEGEVDPPNIPTNPVTLTVEIRELKPDKDVLNLDIPEGWPAPALDKNGYVNSLSSATGIFVHDDSYFAYKLGDGEYGYDWYPTRDTGYNDAAVILVTHKKGEEQDIEDKFREVFWRLIEEKFTTKIWESLECEPRATQAIIDKKAELGPSGDILDLIKSLAKNVIMCKKDGNTWFELNNKNIGTKDSIYITGEYIYEGYGDMRSQAAVLPGMHESLTVRFGSLALQNVKWDWQAARSTF